MGDRVDPDVEMRRLTAMSDRVRSLRRKIQKLKESVEAQEPPRGSVAAERNRLATPLASSKGKHPA